MIAAGACSAQDPLDPIEQGRLANIEQSSLEDELSPDAGTLATGRFAHPGVGQIGLVRRHPVPETLTVYTRQAVSYTSNAFLAPAGERGDQYWSGSFGLTYIPYSVRDFTPSLTLEKQYFRYDEFSQLDFESFEFRAAVKYDFNKEDTLFGTTSYGYNQLNTSRFDIGEFYKYGLLNQSFTKIDRLGDKPFFLSTSVGAGYRHGDPSALDRLTTYVSAGIFYVPGESFSASLFFRPEGQFYLNPPIRSDRTDLNLAVGLSASYRFNEDASLGAFLQYVGNYSNAPSRDYHTATLGLSLSLTAAF